MQGKVESGDEVVLAPVPVTTCGCVYAVQQERATCQVCEGWTITDLLDVGDIVLVKVKGNTYLHLISAIRGKGSNLQYQISNNKGHVNGWVKRPAIYGVAIQVAGKVIKELPDDSSVCDA